MSSYITDPEAWAEKCVENPRWLAECLQRLGRFGGQHPTANVLIHSLEVHHMCQHESPEIQLWALYHDAHEVLTGEIVRRYKRPESKASEYSLDLILRRHLGIKDWQINVVQRHDGVCGDTELRYWGGLFWQYKPHICVDTFEVLAKSLIEQVAERNRRGKA